MSDEINIEQEYGRFIPPVIEKEIKKSHEEQELEFDSVEETEDGGALITLVEEEQVDSSFYDNLAEIFPNTVLQTTATELLDLIEKDKEAREKRDKQYEEGLRRTGLGDDAPGGASFSGASKVVHPVMAEACVDFASRAMKELFPPQGPVRTKVMPPATRQKLEKADRKREFMNWQLTTKVKNYRSELEQLLTQLPLGGGQYLKWWFDEQHQRPDCEFVPIDNIYLPYACTNFYKSPRVTHAQDISRFEFDRRVRLGMYRDIKAVASSITPEESASSEANAKIEGKESSAYNEDGLRRVYEVYVTLSFDDDEITGGDVAPYIISIDEDSQKILSIYRNWEEGDASFEKLDWMVEFPFIPWRGAYPIGLPQLIGGLSAALTGALRALLDSAHINNFPALLKLKGAGRSIGGQSKQVDPTEVSEIEGPVGVDDIRKLIMSMPYNPPSPVLFQLLDWLTGQAKSVVATASESLADTTTSTPVGTALALIEQGSITYSAIHARLHAAQAKSLEILSRLNRMFLDDKQVVEDLGDLVITREDFEGPQDIIPVSDPNIFSEAQRYAQVQAILQLETVSEPGTFNKYAVRRRALSLMHVDDVDEILPPPPSPQELNAVAENVSVSYGQPLAVFPEQDHLAHIEAHLSFVTDPNTGGNPLFSAALMPVMEHVKQHITMFYAETVNNALHHLNAQQLAEGKDVREQDDAIAKAALLAQQAIGEIFSNFKVPFNTAMSALQASQKAAAENIQDPSAKAMLQAALAETERKSKADQADAKIRENEVQQRGALENQRQNMDAKHNFAKLQQEAEARIIELKKEVIKLKEEREDKQRQSITKEQELDLREREHEVKVKLDAAELELKRAEFERKVLETQNKTHLENRRLDVQAAQVIANSHSQESSEPASEEAPEEASKKSEISELREMVSKLIEMQSKPKKVRIVRDKRGKATHLEKEE